MLPGVVSVMQDGLLMEVMMSDVLYLHLTLKSQVKICSLLDVGLKNRLIMELRLVRIVQQGRTVFIHTEI